MSIHLLVSGDFACFTRPELKAERVSYDVMTPSAARNILQSIYWKPEFQWVVEEIHVLAPIRFTNIKRNELSSKIPLKSVRAAMKTGKGNLGISIQDARLQRNATILRDVVYGIKARYSGKPEEMAKHLAIFERRAGAGQCFQQPFLGCREFVAKFELVDQFPTSPMKGHQALGLMFYDRDYERAHRPHFFRAKLNNGVLTVPPFNETLA